MEKDMDSQLLNQIDNIQMVLQNVDFTLELKDHRMEELFFVFKVASRSTYLLLCLAFVKTVFSCSYWYFTLRTEPSLVTIILSCLSIFFTVFLFWILVIVRLVYPLKYQVQFLRDQIRYLEVTICLSTVFIQGFILWCYCNGYLCSKSKRLPVPSDLRVSLQDASFAPELEVVLQLLFGLCLSPLVSLCTLSFISFRTIILCQLSKLCFLAMVLPHLTQLFPFRWFLSFVFLLMGAMILYRLQLVSLFVVFQKTEEEQRIYQIQKAANNVCSMIAHDLKTPVAAVLTGFEEIRQLTKDSLHLVDALSNNNWYHLKKSLSETLSDCKTCGDHLVGTYHFLLMVINRATDYTKCFHNIKLTPKITPVCVSETILSAISVIKQLQGNVSIQLLINRQEMIAEYIFTDADWLRENLLCLLLNAIKFSEARTAVVKVKRIIKTDNSLKQFLLIEVEDSGPGFPFENRTTNDIADIDERVLKTLKKIIELPDYYRRDDLGGMGLGLFCLSQRMYALGGSYGIKKRKKGRKGCNIWFTIPYQEYSSREAVFEPLPSFERRQSTDSEVSPVRTAEAELLPFPLPIQEREPISAEVKNSEATEEAILNIHSERPRKILIVEDSLPIAKLMSNTLNRNGYETVIAMNGSEALKIIQGGTLVDLPSPESQGSASSTSSFNTEDSHRPLVSFGAILMDLQMPIMNGFTAIREIRAREQKVGMTVKQFIVAISAGATAEDVQHAYDCGADYFLQKPFEMKTFLKLLEDHRRVMP